MTHSECVLFRRNSARLPQPFTAVGALLSSIATAFSQLLRWLSAWKERVLGVGWISVTSLRVSLSGLLTSLVRASVSELVNEQFLCRIQLPSSFWSHKNYSAFAGRGPS